MTRERRQDFVREVDTLLRAAFDTGAEADLVARLRGQGVMACELTETGPGGLTSYAALSWMQAPEGWLCLAPVAVTPGAQGRGLGRRAVERARDWALSRGHTVVVLGDPGYYGACGFSGDRAARLTSPYPITHTLLAGPGDDAPQRNLVYPAAFADMS